MGKNEELGYFFLQHPLAYIILTNRCNFLGADKNLDKNQ